MVSHHGLRRGLAAQLLLLSGWLSRGPLVRLHLQAAFVALAFFVAAPLVLFTFAYAFGVVLALAADLGLGSPIFYPLGVVLIVVVGVAATVGVSVLGVALDLARRRLRWSIWAPPAAVLPAAVLLAFGAALAWDVEAGKALVLALLLGALSFRAFLAYWVPLASIEAAWLFLGRIARVSGEALAGARELGPPDRSTADPRSDPAPRPG